MLRKRRKYHDASVLFFFFCVCACVCVYDGLFAVEILGQERKLGRRNEKEKRGKKWGMCLLSFFFFCLRSDQEQQK